MKKKVTLFLFSMIALAVSAQTDNMEQRLTNIYTPEDTAVITTINDIINVQQEVTSRNTSIKHFADVWSRQSYVNLSFNNATLTPDKDISTGVTLNGGLVPEFKSDWGLSIQVGRSYKLHKKTIANTLLFNIDWTYIDFNVNHFKAEGDKDLYNSQAENTLTDEDGDEKKYYYIPWNLQKYDFNYGMGVGPSITVAPFNSINARGLHYVKLNFYYHIGYHVSLLYMVNDKKSDVNPDISSERYDKMKDNLKLSLGHGLTHSFGVNLTWKFIGIGYEHRSAKLKYKSLNKSDFGDENYDFKAATNRFYLQFRM